MTKLKIQQDIINDSLLSLLLIIYGILDHKKEVGILSQPL